MDRKRTLSEWMLAIFAMLTAAFLLAIGIAGAAVEIVKFLFYLFFLLFLGSLVVELIKRSRK